MRRPILHTQCNINISRREFKPVASIRNLENYLKVEKKRAELAAGVLMGMIGLLLLSSSLHFPNFLSGRSDPGPQVVVYQGVTDRSVPCPTPGDTVPMDVTHPDSICHEQQVFPGVDEAVCEH